MSDVKLATLADLKPRVYQVEIAGTGIVIAMRVPSWVEWSEIGSSVVEEPVEMKWKIINGKKQEYTDPDEKREAVLAAHNKRCMRRLGVALREGGGFPELEGLTLEEIESVVSDLDSGLVNALWNELYKLAQLQKGALTESAKTFPGVSGDGDADLSA